MFDLAIITLFDRRWSEGPVPRQPTQRNIRADALQAYWWTVTGSSLSVKRKQVPTPNFMTHLCGQETSNTQHKTICCLIIANTVPQKTVRH